MDNFKASISEFNAAAAGALADSTKNKNLKQEEGIIKSAVMATISRYADGGHRKCEWLWPIKLRKDVKKEILEHLKGLDFKVSKLGCGSKDGKDTPDPNGKRDGLVISW
mgnify:CR=1 FL=1